VAASGRRRRRAAGKGRAGGPAASFAVAVAVAVVAAGCSGESGPAATAPEPAGAPPLQVVASFYPLYEFARQVGGDRVAVTNLVLPGIEPHDWEPSPRDAARIRSADVFIYLGAGFEPWVDRLLAELGPVGPRVVVATEGLPLVAWAPAAAGEDDHGHDPGPGQEKAEGADGPPDPHVWLDPVLAARQVELIRDALAEVDPDHAAAYRSGAQAYLERLAELDLAFRDGLADCRHRDVITTHDAFSYLGNRYGFRVHALMGLAPDAEPSPARLAALVRLARELGLRYVFFETLVHPRVAEAIAREVGAVTLVLNPIEGLTRAEEAAGEDYVSLMRRNLEQLRTALECR